MDSNYFGGNIMSENQRATLNQNQITSAGMKVKLYSSPVITLKENDTLDRVLLKMQLNHIKTLVIASDNKPLGIVTERDINSFLENDKTKRALDQISLQEIMIKKPITIAEGQQDHFEQCAMRMETFKIGTVIVVNDEGKLVGITTKTDVTNAYSEKYQGKYKVKDYMTNRVVTCRKSDSLKFALNMLNRNAVTRLVVTDKDGNPEGIITTNTFLRHAMNFKKGSSKAKDSWPSIKWKINLPIEKLLTEDLLTINPEEDLAKAAHLMIDNIISGLPVVDKNKNLVGIVTKSDIVRAYTQVEKHKKLLAYYKQTH